MTRFFILCFALVLNGCTAKQPATANLMIDVTNQSKNYTGTAAVIRGEDKRNETAVILYQVQDEVLSVPPQTAPHILITGELAEGLRRQGLVLDTNSTVRILLALDDLLVTVTKPELLYSAKAKSRISLTVVSGTTTLTKNYDRETTTEFITRPDVEELEEMLNSQLTGILDEVLADEKIHAAISATRI